MLTGLLSVLILGLLSKPTKARSAIILLSRSMLLPSTLRTRRRALRFANSMFRYRGLSGNSTAKSCSPLGKAAI